MQPYQSLRSSILNKPEKHIDPAESTPPTGLLSPSLKPDPNNAVVIQKPTVTKSNPSNLQRILTANPIPKALRPQPGREQGVLCILI